jgi:hypothetical protein
MLHLANAKACVDTCQTLYFECMDMYYLTLTFFEMVSN